MPSWEGHKPDTSVVLLDLLTTAATGSVRFSASERVLFTACEFWAAAQNRTVAGWLEEDAESRLHAAEQSFTAIGLKGVARVLRRGRCHLTDIDLPVSPRRVARAIETALAGIDEPVDEAIARFAKQKARERHSS